MDRLSRDAKFIFTLRDSGVDFVCADIPEANTLTIGLLAVLAEEEARRISERTKSALSEINRKLSSGVEHVSKNGNIIKKLGSPQNLTEIARQIGRDRRVKKAYGNVESRKTGAFIVSLKDSGLSFSKITESLNKAGFKAPRGGQFSIVQTQRLYERYSL